MSAVHLGGRPGPQAECGDMCCGPSLGRWSYEELQGFLAKLGKLQAQHTLASNISGVGLRKTLMLTSGLYSNPCAQHAGRQAGKEGRREGGRGRGREPERERGRQAGFSFRLIKMRKFDVNTSGVQSTLKVLNASHKGYRVWAGCPNDSQSATLSVCLTHSRSPATG